MALPGRLVSLAVIIAMNGPPMTRLRCAILDDYLNLALTIADWSKVSDRVDVTVFNEPFASAEAAASALQDFEIICAMRERTPFPRTLFAALPKLKLLITSGMRNAALDLEAAKDHQVVLCGTQWGRDPTAPLTMGLILELTRNIARENARMHAGERLQKFVGREIEGFSVEPAPVDQPFRKLANIVLTPHLGYVTEEGFRNHYAQMVEGIDAWFKGEPLRRLA